jgi:hypothetical protein
MGTAGVETSHDNTRIEKNPRPGAQFPSTSALACSSFLRADHEQFPDKQAGSLE